MSEAVSRSSGDLTVTVHLNGKAKCSALAVRSFPNGSTGLIAVHEINPVRENERQAFLKLIPETGDREEVESLLLEIADEVAAIRAEPKVSNKPDGTPASKSVDVEPWPEPVVGADLLAGLSAHIRRYIHLPPELADAIAAWTVLTHCVEWLTFATLLVIYSASKRCGKTALLALLAAIVRRGRLTSATGITAAVLFRLNERDRPTLCLDEAEKLQARHAAPELIELINSGYRRGGKVYRCVERSFDIQEFDAFGFRALALIGKPWDTITDRGVLAEMQRKPRTITVARFHESVVERAGFDFARQARRWTTDETAALQDAYNAAPRPAWLGDRDCDNWAGLFAIANVAAGEWPERIELAARILAGSRDDDGDIGERLIHDVRSIFLVTDQPAVIPSGELLQKLNAIETSGWGDERDGRGLSTHSLARRFKLFGIKPRLDRHPGTHTPTRGYWLADLAPVFERYPAPCNTVTVVTVTGEGTATNAEKLQSDERKGLAAVHSLQTVTTVTTDTSGTEREPVDVAI